MAEGSDKDGPVARELDDSNTELTFMDPERKASY